MLHVGLRQVNRSATRRSYLVLHFVFTKMKTPAICVASNFGLPFADTSVNRCTLLR